MDKNTDWKMWKADAEEQGNLTDGTNLYCDKLMKIPKQHNELLAAVKLLPKNDETRAFHAAVEKIEPMDENILEDLVRLTLVHGPIDKYDSKWKVVDENEWEDEKKMNEDGFYHDKS